MDYITVLPSQLTQLQKEVVDEALKSRDALQAAVRHCFMNGLDVKLVVDKHTILNGYGQRRQYIIDIKMRIDLIVSDDLWITD